MTFEEKTDTGIGDEGGFAPPITQPEEALDLLTEAVAKAGILVSKA